MSLQCRLTPAAVLILMCGASAASAQTAMVRSAPPGSSIELTLNGGTAVTARADGYGDATLAVPPLGRETDVQLHVDVCGNLTKVLINEPGQAPAAADTGCTRKDMWGVYIMRPDTTFVIEINGTDSAVYVSQGPPPRAWLARGDMRVTRLPWGTAGRGLAISAGAGLSDFGQAVTEACAGLATCTADGTGLATHLGAEFWITRNAAVQVSYLRPGSITATGGSDTFSFETKRVTRVLTIGGKAGVPVGPGRIYALGGVNRHEATLTTTETVDDQTVTVDGVNQTIKGGTQAFADKTRGWSWMLGGGYELWTSKWVGIYGEVTRTKLKGSNVSGGDAVVDEQGTFIIGGVRVRLWK
jgi:hypothetical protein